MFSSMTDCEYGDHICCGLIIGDKRYERMLLNRHHNHLTTISQPSHNHLTTIAQPSHPASQMSTDNTLHHYKTYQHGNGLEIIGNS